jgi:hypothetical protein
MDSLKCKTVTATPAEPGDLHCWFSLVKRRHGLNRCRYKGQQGIKRWVGLGVIGDNLINIGRALATPART